MAQLVLGTSEVEVTGSPGVFCPALSMATYPRSDKEKTCLRESLLRSEAPSAHKGLVDAALAACAGEQAAEQKAGIQPTTYEFLSSLLRCGDSTLVPTARRGWELLMLSPSLHGPVEACTAPDVCDAGTNAVYLDRHKVFPKDYCSGLTSLKLERGDNRSQVYYRYWRKRLVSADAVMGVALGRHLSAANDVPFDVCGLLDLVGLQVRVADTPGVFLKGFQLVPLDASGAYSRHHVRYLYWSLTAAPPPSVALAPVEENATEWNDCGPMPKGCLFYLDRHRVPKEEKSGHLLKGFVLEQREKPAGVQQEGALQVRFRCVRETFHALPN